MNPLLEKIAKLEEEDRDRRRRKRLGLNQRMITVEQSKSKLDKRDIIQVLFKA